MPRTTPVRGRLISARVRSDLAATLAQFAAV